MEPLGAYEPRLARAMGVVAGVLAAALAAGLFELSRQLADKHKGRWYAGNGRDVFHAGAAATMAGALALNGLPPALAFAVAGTATVVPLMVLDWIGDRRKRMLALLAAVSVGLFPAVIAPKLTVRMGNAAARMLFGRSDGAQARGSR